MAIRRQNTTEDTGKNILQSRQDMNETANEVARNTTAMETTEAGRSTPTREESVPATDITDASVSSIIQDINETPNVSAQDDLEGQNQQLTFPKQGTSDNAQGIFSRIDAILQEGDAVRDREGLAEKDVALQNAIAETIGTLSQRGEVTEQLQEEFGIGRKSQELADIQNTIRSKQKSYRDRIERARNNGALTQRQQEARVAEIERKGASEMADLAIIEQAKQNNLTTARSLVKDKVDLRFSDEETKLEGLQFFFNNNRDLLDKATEEEIQQNLLRQQTKLGIAKDQYSRLENTKLDVMERATQNGAPNAVLQDIQEAETVSEARQAAGDFAIDMTERLRQQQIQGQIDLQDMEMKQMEKRQEAVENGEMTEDQLDTALDLESTISGRQGYKDLQDIASGLRGTLSAASQETGAGDIAMVNAFQRLIDPGATVREGDVQLLQSAQSIYDEAQTKIQRAGGDTVKFSDQFRQNLIDTASDLYDAQVDAFVDSVEPIKRNAEARNIDFEEYVLAVPGSSQDVKDSIMQEEFEEGFENLGVDDESEIDSAYGDDTSGSTEAFNPDNYFE